MQRFLKTNSLLLLILIVGAAFRIYGLNWDQGYHLHPDERAIVMFTTPLRMPSAFSEFFSPQSSLNPHFFAYGSFPIYLLKIIGEIFGIFNPIFKTYSEINILGRAISAIFDIGTLIALFFIGKKLFSKSVGLYSSFFYCVSVLPIQLSHFYAVDTILTFFVTLTIYKLIIFYEKPSIKKAILIGFLFGFSLATKISAVVLFTSIGSAIAIDFLLIFIKNLHRPHIWVPHLPIFLKKLIIELSFIVSFALITFCILEPYALIDFKTFFEQNIQQYQMTHDAFTFPYTLQYVGKIPYLYELKNIFFWGMGPILGTLSFLGIFYFAFIALKKEKKDKWAQELILLIFFLVYFFMIGRFAIGFMRYLLPIYPLLCLFAAVFVFRLLNVVKNKNPLILNTVYIILFSVLLIWPLSFIYIYTKPNTRVLASEWITKNIPEENSIAIEHWDDSLPLYGLENYNVLTLALYDPDTAEKWETINKQLSKTDYIIIASNRLYVPLMKLTDCQNLPPGRCYPQTAQYYKKLFNGSLGFKKVAEFSIFPSLVINHSSLIINDSSADESFTVYDHPKVMIFKKSK